MSVLARFALSLTLAASLAVPVAAAPTHRVVLLSLDGCGEQMVERMLAEGEMPQLSALIREGVAADYARTNFTSKTAAGHASLWTGTWGAFNGVTANRVPKRPLEQHSILEGMSGFDSGALDAEPIFVTAARAGRRVMAFNLTQTMPLSAYKPDGRFGKGLGDRLFLFSGFNATPAGEGTWDDSAGLASAVGWSHLPASAVPPQESCYNLAGRTLYALLIDDPADPVCGYDTCLLTTSRDAAKPLVRLKPHAPGDLGAWSPLVSVPVGSGLWGVYFRLYALSPGGGNFLLYHGAPSDPQTNRPEWMPAYYQAGGGHLEGAGVASYAHGRLGRTIAGGGDGTAELRFLDTLRFMLHRYRATTAHFMQGHPWDLFMHYLPVPDEAGHLWQGYVMPGSPAYDPAIAQKLEPSMRAVYREIDAYVGALRRSLPPETDLILVSDHGMGPAAWDFHPNVVLRRAGLLAVDGQGHVDLSRTKAIYSFNDGGYVVVNATGRPGGIVPPDQREAVLGAVRKALGAIRVKTPGGDAPLVREMIVPTPEFSAEYGAGGPYGGDLYLDVQPGYYFNPEVTGTAVFTPRPPNASGCHVFDARRPDMHAIFYAVGPDFKRGATIPAIRTIDVAPTIARLLGIQPPPQAKGRVVTEALDATP